MFKNSKKVSEDNYNIIKSIFSSSTGFSDYTLVYAYSMKMGIFSRKISNYILGLSPEEDELIIIPFDITDMNPGEVSSLFVKDLDSVKRNMHGYTIIESVKLQKKIKVIIPPFTAKNAENMYQLSINQKENEVIFRRFFKNLKNR